MNDTKTGFGTSIIHAGQEPDALYGALATPIYQTSTFCFPSVEEACATFGGERPDKFGYSRGGNPTVATAEKKIAALEGGESCCFAASGMGAVGATLLGLLKAGDHLVCAKCVYGCTDVVVRDTLPQFGVEITLVDTSDLEEVRAAIKDNTKVIYFETLSNPTMKMTDVSAISEIAHEKNITVVVDNTFTPPPVIYPLKEGADIVIHSCTKYINGHGDIIAGAIIGSQDTIATLRQSYLTKVCGATPSPFNAYLLIRGMQTMELRMARHGENGMAVAKYLETVPHVKAVYYPGLESSPEHETAKKMMKNGNYGGMIAFELKDGINGMSEFDACKKLMNSMHLASIAVSLGDPETLIEFAAGMTHGNLTPEVRKAAGIREGLIRLSVGLENAEDIIADFEQAFAQL